MSSVRPSRSEWGWTRLVQPALLTDRKSTRLNSSHGYISYAVFCLKKKKKIAQRAGPGRRAPPIALRRRELAAAAHAPERQHQSPQETDEPGLGKFHRCRVSSHASD